MISCHWIEAAQHPPTPPVPSLQKIQFSLPHSQTRCLFTSILKKYNTRYNTCSRSCYKDILLTQLRLLLRKKNLFSFLRLWISCPQFSLCALLLAPVFLISYSLCSHPNESFSNPSEEFFELNISFDFSPHPAEFLSVYFFNICFPSFYLPYIFLLNLTLFAKERGGITEQCILWGAFPIFLFVLWCMWYSILFWQCSLHCEGLLAAVDLLKPPRGKRCLHRFTKSLSDCDEMAELYTFEIFEEETPLTWTSRLCNPVLIPEFGPNFQG